MRFTDRRQAGRVLADRIAEIDPPKPIVVALPRGGVPVGHEIARALGCPLDVLVVRKVGAPSEPEFAVGAVAGEAPPYLHKETLDALGIDENDLEPIVAAERQEVRRRTERYRAGREPLNVAGHSVVLVDDGVATGATARVGLRSIRHARPAGLIFAAPVCAREAAAALREDADDVVCAHVPVSFMAVGEWYDEFPQLTDDEVTAMLTAR